MKKKFEKQFNNGENNVSIFVDDVINFLKSLPDESVDIIATDPAYLMKEQL